MPPAAPLSAPLSPATPFLLTLLLGVVATGSLCTWAAIAARWWRGTDVLRYEPRRHVPWTALDLGVMLLLGFVALMAVRMAADLEPGASLAEMSTRAVARLLVFDGASKLTLVLVGAAVLALRAGARLPDLGLATTAGQMLADLWLGIVAFLAAVVPVYLIQLALYALQSWMDWKPTPHPLEKMLTDDPSLEIIAVAVFTAVVVAPIFEEFVFRLVLQGWLEKIETGWLRGDTVDFDSDEHLDDTADQAGGGEADAFNPVEAIGAPTSNPFRSPQAATAVGKERPPSLGTRRWPRGMFPIALSSTLFALLHIGHGFDPLPLWVLAIGLGLVYQRTHRFFPCVVLHMAFNAFGLMMMWLRP